MLMNKLIIVLALCFFVCASIFIWIKLRKIGSPLLILIIGILFIFFLGVSKLLIVGSMRLDPYQPVTIFESNSEFNSRGDEILGSLKSWSKILRGKKPIYTTKGGSQISLDPIGDEKSIKLFKRF